MIYLAVLAMTLIGAMGAFFLKAGMDQVNSPLSVLKTPKIYLGGCFYVTGALLNVFALRYMDYSILYPMTAITYVWSMLLSATLLGERITRRKVAGVIAILAGVFLLTR